MARTTRSSVTNAEAPATPTGKESNKKKQSASGAKKTAKSEPGTTTVPANSARKRARSAVKQESPEPSEDEEEEEKEAPSTKRTKTTKAPPKPKSTPKPKPKSKSSKPPPQPDLEAGAKVAASLTSANNTTSSSDSPSKPGSTSKANPYNLSPGTSPYPTYPHPSPSECRTIHDALASIHGTVSAPQSIATPSLTSSGCGEVPSVLDALVRTRLSAATNGANSSRAFRGLVEKYGLIKEGIGKGSVDWMAVRASDVSEVFACIKSGGLADVKSRDIKKILDLVYEENVEQQLEQRAEEGKGTQGKLELKVLSLDHLHGMQSDAAFQKLLGYPGIGPKTASCVLLFCMQRPSFAVDTHVFRLTRWLGWTPSDSQVRGMGKGARKEVDGASADVETNGMKEEDGTGFKEEDDEAIKAEDDPKSKQEPPPSPAAKKAKAPPPVSRNTTYAHLDIRIPDELKYPLHYLFIKHGKTCPECSAKADRKVREEWGGKKCPIKQFKRGSKKQVLAESGEGGGGVKDEEEGSDDASNEVDGEEDGESDAEYEAKDVKDEDVEEDVKGEDVEDGDVKEKEGEKEKLHGIETQMVL